MFGNTGATATFDQPPPYQLLGIRLQLGLGRTFDLARGVAVEPQLRVENLWLSRRFRGAFTSDESLRTLTLSPAVESLVRELVPSFDIVALDLPGHGHSSAPAVDYTAAYFTDMPERFLDACGLENAVLVGESIGASIALGLAARRNPRVARVVALNPYDYGRWGEDVENRIAFPRRRQATREAVVIRGLDT